MSKEHDPKIYLLPNLMTAGNLFCGFVAIIIILRGIGEPVGGHGHYYLSIGLILGACLFDLLDGRFARLGNQESAFGREFDSIADIVSFGVAPALLVYDMVLAAFPDRIGWIIAFVYLLCGAMRLARFNVLAASREGGDESYFSGFPIPAAAGVIASLTLFLLWLDEGKVSLGAWIDALPPLLLLLSYLMFSNIRYPSFKNLTSRTKRPLPWVFGAIVILVLTVMNWEIMPALLFVSYMLYGLVRPWVSKRWRAEIEQVEYDPAADDGGADPGGRPQGIVGGEGESSAP